MKYVTASFSALLLISSISSADPCTANLQNTDDITVCSLTISGSNGKTYVELLNNPTGKQYGWVIDSAESLGFKAECTTEDIGRKNNPALISVLTITHISGAKAKANFDWFALWGKKLFSVDPNLSLEMNGFQAEVRCRIRYK